MRIRTLLVLLVIALIAGFAALNWPAFTTPSPLNLGLSTVEAPLGLAMLGLIVFITLAFAVYVAVWQASILMETRRHAKELQAQRTLADQAEASRFTELRAVLHAELERLEQRIDAAQESLRADIRDGTNSLAAMLGEIDDRTRPRLPNAAP